MKMLILMRTTGSVTVRYIASCQYPLSRDRCRPRRRRVALRRQQLFRCQGQLFAVLISADQLASCFLQDALPFVRFFGCRYYVTKLTFICPVRQIKPLTIPSSLTLRSTFLKWSGKWVSFWRLRFCECKQRYLSDWSACARENFLLWNQLHAARSSIYNIQINSQELQHQNYSRVIYMTWRPDVLLTWRWKFYSFGQNSLEIICTQKGIRILPDTSDNNHMNPFLFGLMPKNEVRFAVIRGNQDCFWLNTNQFLYGFVFKIIRKTIL